MQVTASRRTRAVQSAGAADAAPARPAAAGSARSATTFVRSAEQRTLAKMSVRERFATMEQRFLPDKAKGVNATFLFDLSGKDGGTWFVEIKGGKIKVTPGRGSGTPTVAVKASAEDYRKIADGEMSSTWAYLRGKLKMDGDKDLAKRFKTFFRD